MQANFLRIAHFVRLGTTVSVVALVLVGCKLDGDRDNRHNPNVDGRVDQQSALLLLEAQEAFRTGDVGKALVMADSAQRSAGQTGDAFLADVHFLQGRAYSELNDFDAARRSYERTLSLDPLYRGAHLNLGNNAFRLGRYRRAIHHYEKEYENHGDPRMHVYAGRSYLELGQSDSARLAFEGAIAESDSFAEPYARLAHLFDQNGEIEQGLIYARSALERRPASPDYRYLLGSMLLRSGKVGPAAEEFRRVIAQQPDKSEGFYGLGRAMARLDHVDEAARLLRAADSLKQIEDGLREYETKTRLYSNDPAAWATYGYALHQAGRDAEAMQAYQTALHIDPENVEIRFRVANLFLKHGDFKRALDEYNAVLQKDEAFVPAWINAGIALARIGLREAARAAWESALRHDPDNETAREYLNGLPSRR